jgi:hypothetical protein
VGGIKIENLAKKILEIKTSLAPELYYNFC